MKAINEPAEQKQPQPGEWWRSDALDENAFICGFDWEGDPVFQTDDESPARIDRTKEFCEEWHHEPDCTGFDWTPPPAIDPGEGWELLPKRVILQKDDQCLGVDGNWRNTIYAGEEGSDLNTYRRRRKPAEWPKYYVPSDPLRKTGHGKHVAYYQKNIHGDGITVHVDGTDFMWKYGGMEYLGIETTKAEALARVTKPAETWPKYFSGDKWTELDAYIRFDSANSEGVWVGSDGSERIHSGHHWTTVAEAIADYDWRELTEAEAKARVTAKPQAATPRIQDHRPARDVILDIVSWLDGIDGEIASPCMALETAQQWLEDNPEPPTVITKNADGKTIELQGVLCDDGHTVELMPVESPDDWIEITDPEHIIRQCDQISDYGTQWYNPSSLTNACGKQFHSCGFLRARCRRRDLPDVKPKRIPVRLYWYDGNIVGRYDHSPPTDPSFQELNFDGSGFYVTQGDG